MRALQPAKVKEVRLDEETGTATVIVPDYQLSLAIGKEGQNARLAARLSGWRVDIKSETQLVEEEEYANQDWAEGEWVTDEESGELVWKPAEGGEAMTVEDYAHAGEAEEAKKAEADIETVEDAGTPPPAANDDEANERSGAESETAADDQSATDEPAVAADEPRRRGRISPPTRTCIGCREAPKLVNWCASSASTTARWPSGGRSRDGAPGFTPAPRPVWNPPFAARRSGGRSGLRSATEPPNHFVCCCRNMRG